MTSVYDVLVLGAGAAGLNAAAQLAATGCRVAVVEARARRRALITLPLGVLQSGVVRFDPQPAERLLTAGQMAMGTAIRIPLLFQSRFWCAAETRAKSPAVAGQLDELRFLFSDHGVPPTWWTSHPDETALLTGWLGGPATATLLPDPGVSGSDAAAIETSLKTLAALFSSTTMELRRHLAGAYFHDWSADPFARGAYSYVPAGALQASQQLAAPWRKRCISPANMRPRQDIGARCTAHSTAERQRRSPSSRAVSPASRRYRTNEVPASNEDAGTSCNEP